METVQKKICLLGEFSVGKTSLVRRFVEGSFDDKYLSTIGVKISRRKLTRPYGEMNLLVWDLAGGEEFGVGAGAAYLRGAAGAIIVCDLTRRGTLPAIERYTRQMQSVNPGSPLVFVGNKVDLTEARAITDEDLRAACEPINGGTFFLTSAKTGEQVEAVFDCLAEQIEAQK